MEVEGLKREERRMTGEYEKKVVGEINKLRERIVGVRDEIKEVKRQIDKETRREKAGEVGKIREEIVEAARNRTKYHLMLRKLNAEL